MSDISLADALFRPRSVALVGASGDVNKNTARPQRYLKKHGFKGKIIPINPGRDEILGERAFPDVASIPDPVDHVFIMTPAATVPAIVEQCCDAGVKVATIFSDGFAEIGDEGAALQQRVVETARAGGLRLVGPNSMGVIDVAAGSTLTLNAILEMPEIPSGPIGLVSQSGTMLGTLISRAAARGMGFSRLISVGNEADLSVGEIGDMLVDDPNTGVIALFLETVRDPAVLAAMARRAHAAGKPVIAYKLGRSSAGQAMAVSHTGAIAGDDAAATAFFRHHGIIRVDMLETLFEIVPMVVGRKPPKGKRVGVLTTTGGGAATVVDRLGSLGVDLVNAPQAVREAVAPFGIRISDGPLSDLTMAGTKREVYQAALEALLGCDDCDAVVAVVGSSAQFHPQHAVEPIIGAAGMSDKPLAVFLVPQADDSLNLLADANIAAFRTPESCADAMRACLDWRDPVIMSDAEAPELDRIASLLGDSDSAILDEIASRDVFGALGIAQASAQLVTGEAIPSDISYPVAAKIVSPDIPHKTEAGGVVLGIADEGALRDAIIQIKNAVAKLHPNARIDGILVQKMEQGLAESLIGYRYSAETGPIVTLAPGGTLAELYKDASVRLAPVDLATARDMIVEVTGLAPIRGYRGMQKGDVAALAAAIVALSSLALLPDGAPRVMEAEINPLLIREEGAGVVAVDGLIVTA
jgi:acyl-CoA synthetase (NDP forming)